MDSSAFAVRYLDFAGREYTGGEITREVVDQLLNKVRAGKAFSFLLSLPAVLGATLLKVLDVMELEGGFPQENLPKYLLGMVIAAVVGYFSIQLVKLLTSKGRFGVFAFYCWGAGALSLLLIFMDWTFVPTA